MVSAKHTRLLLQTRLHFSLSYLSYLMPSFSAVVHLFFSPVRREKEPNTTTTTTKRRDYFTQSCRHFVSSSSKGKRYTLISSLISLFVVCYHRRKETSRLSLCGRSETDLGLREEGSTLYVRACEDRHTHTLAHTCRVCPPPPLTDGVDLAMSPSVPASTKKYSSRSKI